MTRIIAGSAGGRRLATPPGEGTRPTSDRVREAVFSALEAAVGSWAGVRFLDLYAGSGAVGLEAVSRGAARATLVEQHRRTAGVARRNVQALGLPGVEVVVARAESLVAGPPREPLDPCGAYDIVFLDPPYDLADDVVTTVLARLVDQGWLAPDALVVVERSGRGPDLAWPPGLRGVRTRRYGETAVWYGRAT